MRNVGVIGTGRWGRNHVRTLHALGALAAVCDSNPATLAAVASEFAGVTPFATLAAMLEDARVTAVVIASPASQHYRLAAEALEADRDVLVEKPLALTVAGARALCSLAAERGRVLGVGHLYEYHPAIERIHELIADEVIGAVQYADSIRLNLGVIRTEEDVLWSVGPHDFSVLLRMANALPSRLSVTAWEILQPGIPDVADCTMEFPNGLRAHVHVSWMHPEKERRLVVIGDRGALMFDDIKKTLMHSSGYAEITPAGPRVVLGEQTVVPFAADPPLERELAQFIACMESRSPMRADGESGVRVLELLEACTREWRRTMPVKRP